MGKGMIKKAFFTTTLFLFFYIHLFSHTLVIVMGSSCAGKSTTTQNLHHELRQKKQEKWTLLDLDRILNRRRVLSLQKKCEYDEVHAIDYLVDEINYRLGRGKSVIVDTNMYEERLLENIVGGHKIFQVLIYAPLETLLERDEKRNKRLKRNDRKKQRARAYVVNTFEKFHQIKEENFCDLCLNTHELDIMGCVQKICDLLAV